MGWLWKSGLKDGYLPLVLRGRHLTTTLMLPPPDIFMNCSICNSYYILYLLNLQSLRIYNTDEQKEKFTE